VAWTTKVDRPDVDVAASLTSRYLEVRNFGLSFGIIVSALAIATGLGPLTGGMIYGPTGSYRYLLFGTVPLCAVARVLVVTLGSYPRKRGQQTALLLSAALLVGEFAGVAADGDGGDGAAGEAFVDVVGVVGAAIPFT
jgi:MFS family permease